MYNLYCKADSKIALNSMLHGVYRESTDAEFRANLRLVFAVLLARNFENDKSILTDLLMLPEFYEKGYAAFKDAVAMCAYIGFERVTSKWGKEKGFRCVITARILITDKFGSIDRGTSHTAQIYY